MILVTGGAGFIGSNFILDWLAAGSAPVLNLDKLTYAGNAGNLAELEDNAQYRFVHGDINDRPLIERLLREHRPHALVHFAAESHVDRSIHGPGEFVQTNVVGTFNLLEAARGWLTTATAEERSRFRFLHVSTDEVYGSLAADSPPADESFPYAPSSPYSASKAASDHLVRAYCATYGFPAIITNCSNNYGPRQFPEKLIPLMILNALAGKPLPVYGDGLNIRDWLYVGDHCAALRAVLARGRIGETYNIGGNSEKTNLDVVRTLCAILDELQPAATPRAALLTFVGDRPGHDRRYAIDAGKIARELGWRPQEDFAGAMRKTITWYLDHPQWTARIASGEYRHWLATNYAKR